MTAIVAPALSQNVGYWRAIYWEPVMGSGERLCVGCITTIRGQTKAHKAIKPGVLDALYSAGAVTAEAMLDRALKLLNRLGQTSPCANLKSPIMGIVLGEPYHAHADAEQELIQIALLMSSSMCNMSDPGQLDAAEVASDGGKKVNHQFITRVRNEVTRKRPELTPYFNVEARLLAKKRTVRFGFLSDQVVAHLGLLQSTNLNGTLRNARGLMAEVRMAHLARESHGAALLVLGHPPLTSANLGNADRSAIADCLEELYLEAEQMSVTFASADNDEACADELIALS